MGVFRVDKTKDYTVMSNHHLKNKKLSLKSKGLMCLMLSLPDEWDYTVKGLSMICKDGVDGITATIKELELAGYVTRKRIRNAKGQLTTVEYTIRESPVEQEVDTGIHFDPLNEIEPKRENPILDNPILDNPKQEKPILEKPNQLNTKELNTKELSTKELNTHQSNLSLTSNIQGYEEMGFDNLKQLQEYISKNIRYHYFVNDDKYSYHELTIVNQVIDLITEVVCSNTQIITISGSGYPSSLVKDRLLKVDNEHVDYILDCLKTNQTEIRNVKKYLLATLFNAPTTIGAYELTKPKGFSFNDLYK